MRATEADTDLCGTERQKWLAAGTLRSQNEEGFGERKGMEEGEGKLSNRGGTGTCEMRVFGNICCVDRSLVRSVLVWTGTQ